MGGGGITLLENIIYMIGYKFGTTGNEHFAWAMNSYLPGRVAEKFKDSRIVAFSTLLVYPLTTVKLGALRKGTLRGRSANTRSLVWAGSVSSNILRAGTTHQSSCFVLAMQS